MFGTPYGADGGILEAGARLTQPEFTSWIVDSTRLLDNGDVMRSGHCPAGYVPVAAEQDEAYATPSLLLGGHQFYMRCMRVDVFARPETSREEPTARPEPSSLGDLLASLPSVLRGAGWILAVGAVAYLVGGVARLTGR